MNYAHLKYQIMEIHVFIISRTKTCFAEKNRFKNPELYVSSIYNNLVQTGIRGRLQKQSGKANFDF